MAQQEDKIPLSKKGKREISSFIGHELLYDYLSNSLDEDRQKAVADHIKFSRDAQLNLAKIQNGQGYAEQLSDTVVSQPIIEQISAPSTYLNVLLQKSNFDKWPQGLKWGLEALVVVGVIVSLLTVAPWERILTAGLNSGSKEVILAEVSKSGKLPEVEPVAGAPEFVDEDIKTAKPVAIATTESPSAETKKEASTAPAATAMDEAKPSTTQAGTTASTATTTTAAQAGTGFLYRGGVAVTNIESVGPKIKDKIIELGGRKAGEVELGWSKTPSSMYFHFTIPEAKYQDLNTFLASYGTLKVQKEKHPRIMPDGIVRLIITVDEAKK